MAVYPEKLTNPYQDRVETAKSLFGILPPNADWEEAGAERSGTEKIVHLQRVQDEKQIAGK